MASKKRAKLRRLADPETVSRAQPLGDISRPVNTDFVLPRIKPKIRNVTDLSQLSATVGKALAVKAQIKTKKEEDEDLTKGQAFYRAHPEFRKNLTTFANAVEARLIDPTTRPMFWRGMAEAHGQQVVQDFANPDTGPLNDLENSLSSPDREEGVTIDGEFDRVWAEGPGKLTDTDSLRVVNGLYAKLKSNFVARVGQKYNNNVAERSQSLEVNNITGGLTARLAQTPGNLTPENAQELARQLEEKRNTGNLGDLSADAAMHRGGMAYLDSLNPPTDGNLSATEQLEHIDMALDAARSFLGDGKENKGLVVGTDVIGGKGFRSVYVGGGNKEQIKHRGELEAFINDRESDQRTLEREQDRQGIAAQNKSTTIMRQVETSLALMQARNPQGLRNVATTVAGIFEQAQTDNLSNEDLTKKLQEVFGENHWELKQTEVVNADKVSRGLFVAGLQTSSRSIRQEPTDEAINAEAAFRVSVEDNDFRGARDILDHSPFSVAERTRLEAVLRKAKSAASAHEDPKVNPSFLIAKGRVTEQDKRFAALGLGLTPTNNALVGELGRKRDALWDRVYEGLLEDAERASGQLRELSESNVTLSGVVTDALMREALNRTPEYQEILDEIDGVYKTTEDTQNKNARDIRDKLDKGEKLGKDELNNLLSEGGISQAQHSQLDAASRRLNGKTAVVTQKTIEFAELLADITAKRPLNIAGVVTDQTVTAAFTESHEHAKLAVRDFVQEAANNIVLSYGDKAWNAADLKNAVDNHLRQKGVINAAKQVYKDAFEGRKDKASAPKPASKDGGEVEVASTEAPTRPQSMTDEEVSLRESSMNYVKGSEASPEQGNWEALQRVRVMNPESGVDSANLFGLGPKFMSQFPSSYDWWWDDTQSFAMEEILGRALGRLTDPGTDWSKVKEVVPVPIAEGSEVVMDISNVVLGGPTPRPPSGSVDIYNPPFFTPSRTIGNTITLNPSLVKGVVPKGSNIYINTHRSPFLYSSPTGEFASGGAGAQGIFSALMGELYSPELADSENLTESLSGPVLGKVAAHSGAKVTRSLTVKGFSKNKKLPYSDSMISERARAEGFGRNIAPHYQEVGGNGMADVETLARHSISEMLMSDDPEAVSKAQQMSRVLVIPMSWVINRRAEVTVETKLLAEVSASRTPSWEPHVGVPRFNRNPEPHTDVDLLISTTYSFPYNNDPEETPDEKRTDIWKSRNFKNLAQLDKLLSDPSTYDEKTGSFVKGSEPAQFLKAQGLNVTPEVTAAYIKMQAYLIAPFDPSANEDTMSRFVGTMRSTK